MKKQFLCISIFSLSIVIVMSLTATFLLCCGNPNLDNPCLSTSYEYLQTNDSEIHIKICKRCEFPEQESHSFAWDFNTVHHWQECDDCGYSKDSAFHTYGSNMSITIDTHTKICTACNYRSVESHEISTWAITPMAHRGTCTVCRYTVNEEHTFIGGSCRKCGVSENTVINMIEQSIEQMTITAPAVTE